jgi:ATP-binding cassette subfamily C protein
MHGYSYRSLWEQIRSRPGEFWRLNLYGIAATLLLLPVPMLLPLLIDEVLLGHPGRLTEWMGRLTGSGAPWALIAGVTAAVLALRLLAFAASNRRSLYATRISQRVAYALRHRILRHLDRMALSEYERLRTGGVVARTMQDVEQLSAFASQAVTTALSASLMLTGVAGVLFWMEWRLALLVFLLNPLFLGFSKILGRKTGELLRRQHEAYQLYQELLAETLELFVQVRASNQERRLFGLVRERAKGIERASLEHGYRAAVAQGSSALLTASAVDLFRALGIAAVAYSDLSVGMMIAFLFYLSTLVQPTNQLMGLVIAYQNTRPALERINALLATAREPLYPQELDPFAGRPTVSVALEGIRFAYGTGPEILHGITLRIGEGEKVALVGPSGSGKSTVAQLLVGFYPPRAGRILYGGVPIERIGLERVRSQVALMLQESLFFDDTIRRNLTLGRELPEEKIREALAMAKLERFVRGLERGLETPIGRNGIRLSGGQKQRLAIARLILSDPKVAIFDEATSALDGETEARLYRSLAPFLEKRSVLIIAHRETTIRQADRICLMAEGRIREEGSYAELKRRGLLRADYDGEEG